MDQKVTADTGRKPKAATSGEGKLFLTNNSIISDFLEKLYP